MLLLKIFEFKKFDTHDEIYKIKQLRIIVLRNCFIIKCIICYSCHISTFSAVQQYPQGNLEGRNLLKKQKRRISATPSSISLSFYHVMISNIIYKIKILKNQTLYQTH